MATAQGIQLRNPISGQRDGFLAVLPVYRRGMPIGGVNERRENTLGVIIGAFQTSAVFDSILSKAILPKTVDVYLYEVKASKGAAPRQAAVKAMVRRLVKARRLARLVRRSV